MVQSAALLSTLSIEQPLLQVPISLHTAIQIAQAEIIRLGLGATHRILSLFGDVDRQAEGAAFAVIVSPHCVLPGGSRRSRAGRARRIKLLIHHDGRAVMKSGGR